MTNAPIRVAVIDSGWDRTIDDRRVVAGVGLVGDGRGFEVVVSEDDRDRIGHGTACAGLVLETAPAAEVVPVRVFGERLQTSAAVVSAAIAWAMAHGCRVVNVSLGTIESGEVATLYRACELARRAGAVIVAAAPGTVAGYPAVFDCVIGVGYAEGSLRSEFAYRAEAAIECVVRDRTRRARQLGGGEREVRGTSFAAPVVAGYVARYLRDDHTATLDDVREYLARIW